MKRTKKPQSTQSPQRIKKGNMEYWNNGISGQRGTKESQQPIIPVFQHSNGFQIPLFHHSNLFFL
jgi:hypothetical protein